ncbi:unannotated protein [freshwater metagenome]|uniref:Unannotated protein n=1 Tax=freshwater metagenome TaxID=449393 RepID=A0A6J6X2T7_9ZZZZ
MDVARSDQVALPSHGKGGEGIVTVNIQGLTVIP